MGSPNCNTGGSSDHRFIRLAGSVLLIAAAAAVVVSLAESGGLVSHYQGGRPRDVGYGWLAHLIALSLGSDIAIRLPAAFSRHYELAGWGDFLRFLAATLPLNILLAWLAGLLILPVVLIVGRLPANRSAATVFGWKPSSLLGLWLVFLSPAVLHWACEMSMVGLWLYEYGSRLATGGVIIAVLFLLFRWPVNRWRGFSRFSRVMALIVVTAGAIAVLGGVASGWISAGSNPVAPPAEPRPNILLVSIDTLRADHVSAYGYPRETSPNLDALARDGALFRTALAPSSWTLPSHVTLLTGLPPHQHRVTADLTRLRKEAVTLAEVLRDAGYDTTAIVSAPYLRSEYGLRQGFRLYDDYSAMPLAQNAHRKITSPKLLERVTSWLGGWEEGGRERPFFLFLHMWDVHYDFNPPSPYDTMFDPGYTGSVTSENFEGSREIYKDMDPRDLSHIVALYDGEIRYTDHHLGQVFDFLRERGLLDDTVICVVGVHGEEFFEHGNKGHRNSLYDEVLRVPLIVRYPERIPPGQAVPDQVRLLDVAPTLLSLAGVNAPGSFGMTSSDNNDAGRDLSPLMDGSGTALPPVLAYGHHEWFLASARSPDWKLIVRVDGDPKPEMYDLRADPAEQVNISEQQTDRLDELYASVKTFRSSGAERSLARDMEINREHLEALRSLGYITSFWEKATRAKASLVSPAPGSTLTGPTAEFHWSGDAEVEQYYLKIGSAVDAGDIYQDDQGLQTSVSVTGLPLDGRHLFVQLLWRTGEDWHHEDFNYRAAGASRIVSPQPGATLTGPEAAFRWEPAVGANMYHLKVGSTLDGDDISGGDLGLATSKTVAGLPADGRTIYVRLFWRIGEAWHWDDYEYRAAQSGR